MKKITAVIGVILMALVLFSCAEPETPKYTVSFEGIDHDPITVTVGEKFKLPTKLPTRTGYVLSIMMGDTVLEEGKEYDITADTVLNCSWLELFDVTVDGEVIKVPEGKFTIPAKKGYYTESVKVGDKDYEIGDEIDVTGNIALVYTAKPGTADLEYSGNKVTGYRGSDVNIVIPDATKDGVAITGIDAYAFGNNTKIKSVILGNNIETIGEMAFYGCMNIKPPILPSSLVTIGDRAFSSCWEIREFVIPEGTMILGNRILAGSNNLMKLSIPSTVTEIRSNPVGNIGSDTIVELSSANKNFKLENGSLLTSDGKTLIIGNADGIVPDGVEKIVGSAFDFVLDDEVTSVVIPDSVIEVESRAYANIYLTSVKIGKNVQRFESDVFEECLKLTKITVDKNMADCTEAKGWKDGWHGATKTKQVTVQYLDKTVTYPEI